MKNQNKNRDEFAYETLIKQDHIHHVTQQKYVVKSLADENKRYLVDLDACKKDDRAKMCDGGCCRLQPGVCRHVIAACKKAGVLWHNAIDQKHTTAQWKAAFHGCGVLRVPTTAEIEQHAELRDERLQCPPVIKRRSGAPKKQERLKRESEVRLVRAKERLEALKKKQKQKQEKPEAQKKKRKRKKQ